MTSATQLIISEIMYDPPGANAAHQWIELTNTGDSGVAITGYKLFSEGVHHGVMAVGNDSIIAPGASAILANNTTNFLATYPTYQGPLFKSAFSFLRSGGEISLKDTKLTVLDVVSYEESAGAAGDGNSLHRAGNTFTVGAPNPGSSAPTSPLVPQKTTTTVVAKTTAKPTAKNTTTNTTKAPVSSKPNSYTSYQSAQANDAPLLSQINLPQGPWVWVVGGFGVVLLGVAALIYVFLQAKNRSLNLPAAEEFELE